jgi:hypothetical protein
MAKLPTAQTNKRGIAIDGALQPWLFNKLVNE